MFASDNVLANSPIEKEVDSTSWKTLMKSEPESERLEGVLRDWLDAQQQTPNEQEALSGRITGALHETLQKQSLKSLEPSSKHAKSSRLDWVYLAIAAASVLICMVVWSRQEIGQNQERFSQSNSEAVPEAVGQPAMDSISIDSKARLLAEMQQIFDNRVAWIAETDGKMWFELVDGEKSTGERRMVLRLEILASNSVSAEDSPGRIWAMDLILENEQVVEVRTLATSPEVSVWPYILPDGSVAVETCLNLPGRNAMKSRTTSVFSFDQDGTAQQISSLQGYVLRQSLQLLDQSVT